MLNRGQQTLLAAFWAVLGTCLASVGCETTMGPVEPEMAGAIGANSLGHPGDPASWWAQPSNYSPSMSGQPQAPAATPAAPGQAPATVVRASYTQSSATAPGTLP